ncbi:MAG: hypothetical protein QXY49_03585 [Thermofilaceae archaeon]
MPSRYLVALAAFFIAIIFLIILNAEREIQPLWASRSGFPVAYMWIARWLDLLAQSMMLLAIIVAISHLLKEVVERWESLTPTR